MAKTTATEPDRDELVHHAIAAYGHLVHWGSRLTLPEFAATIRCYSTGQHAEAVIAALELATDFVAQNWHDLHTNWQCQTSLAPASMPGLSSAPSPQGNTMFKSQDDATRATNPAARDLKTIAAAVQSSAALYLLDARGLMVCGSHDQAVCRARDSFAYSVGIFHPNYKTAATI